MSDALVDSLVPIAAELVGTVVHRGCPHGVGLSLARPDTLNGQDAAPRCANTKGPLTPPEPVRTSELP